MNAVSEKPSLAESKQTSRSAAGKPTSGKPGPRRLRSRLLRLLLPPLVLIAAIVTGNWWFTEGRYIESTDNAYVQGDIAVLGPRIDGDVTAIHVGDNQVVHEGDPLITLDPADWQARLDQAHGAAAEAQAASVTARRQIEQARAAIAQADAMIAQAQAEVTRAAAEAGRSGTLVGAGWTSRQSNDQAVANARKADAALASSQAQKVSANEALSVASAQADQADARRVTAEAAVRLAASNLSYTVIRAPFDGIVGNRAAQLGQHVQVGQQLIAVAPPARRLYVTANFKETQLRKMQAGQKVVLTPDIDGNAAVTGRVDSLAPATGALFSLLPPENATGNFTKVVQRVPVKIVIDPADADKAGWLRAGLSVTAEVDTRGAGAQRLGLFGAAAATLGLGR
jgi:membrane fusion protein, multidrug efflux system